MANLSYKYNIVPLLVAIFCTLFFGSVSLVYPFGVDQGIFAYIASQLLEGQKLYQDVFDIKPPPTFYMFSLALFSFGHTMLSIRIVDLLWQSAIAVLIFLITSRIYQKQAIGMLSVFLYVISYYGRPHADTAQTDGFLSLPLTLGILAFLVARDRQSNRWFFFCGLAIGVATLFKYPIGIMLPAMGGLALFYPKPKIWQRLIPGLLIALGGVVAILLLLAFLALRQELDGFLAMNFGYLPFYVRQTSTPFELMLLSFKGVIRFLVYNSILLGLSSIALVLELVLAIRTKRFLHVAPLLFWWIGGLFHLTAQLKFFIYHALPILVPQSILLARGFFILYDWAKPWKVVRRGLSILLILFLASLFVGYRYPQRYQTLWGVVSGEQTLRTAYESVDETYEHYTSVKANLQVVDYIRANTKPTDILFIWSYQPMIYFLAERDSASRHLSNRPLFYDIPGLDLRRELIEELQKNQPVYILIAQNDISFVVTGRQYDSQEAFERFDAFRDFVNKNYTLETVIEDFTLYRRNDGVVLYRE